jgi:hypothetical protein
MYYKFAVKNCYCFLKSDNHVVVILFFFFLQEVAQECQNMNWGTFKVLLADSLIDHLHPIQVPATNMMHFFNKLWCLIIVVCMLYLLLDNQSH